VLTEAAVQAAIDQHFDGNAALYRSFAADCAVQFKLDAAAGESACERGDLAQLHRLAHNLKSALSMLGHASASAVAAELEEQAGTGNAPLARSSWRRLRPALAAPTQASNPGAAGTLEVLYVEDYAPGAALVRHSLERSDRAIHLHVVATAAQAIERLNRFEQGLPPRYDAVLTDLNLPDGNGLDLVSHVRRRQLDLAIVILTAADEADTAGEALRAGADAYVAKRDDYLAQLPGALHGAVERFRTP
jgi:CheY-like chemotaxis protein